VAEPVKALVVLLQIQASHSGHKTPLFMIGWKALNNESLLEQIGDNSYVRPQVILKHSTRCSVSSGVLSRLNQHDTPEGNDFYLLDLIGFRNISNEIAARYDVRHESPQVLLIWQGSCVYNDSHRAVTMEKIQQAISVIAPPSS
jgi:bacillithiol system protein YtxJ